MRPKIPVILALAAALLVACVPKIENPATPSGFPSPSPTIEKAFPNLVKTLPAAGNFTPYPTATGMTPLPDMPVKLTPAQAAAIEAASKKYGIPVEKISLVSTEAVTWRDGCLEVYTPRTMCTDALVDGYRISMEAGGKQLEYHTNRDGTTVVDATGSP